MIEFVYPHTHLVAGVDEVGRGPLVGAVVTAAVILDPTRPIIGLNDSKKLSEKRRLALFDEIKEKALCWSLGRAEPHEIDELNILHATMLAMQRAVAGLSIAPEYVLIDGNRCPALPMPSMAVVKGEDGELSNSEGCAFSFLHRSFPISTYFLHTSKPIYFLPSRCAIAHSVPDPENGTKTISPGREPEEPPE